MARPPRLGIRQSPRRREGPGGAGWPTSPPREERPLFDELAGLLPCQVLQLPPGRMGRMIM
eukprot:4077711-Alexandrium_andersonii.AAC.1